MKTLTIALLVGIAWVLTPDRGVSQDMAAVARGAALYGQTCARCHSARSPTERTDREWVTIVNHMRARANITKSQAQALQVFLQFSNLPEAGAPAAAAAAQTSQVPAGVEAPDRPTVVLLDLTDPRLDAETRAALQRYLRTIGNQ